MIFLPSEESKLDIYHIFVNLQSEQQLDKMLKEIKNCADEHKDESNVNGP